MKKLNLLAASLMLALAPALGSEIVYTEIFPNTTSENAGLNTVGWFAYTSSSATFNNFTNVGVSNAAGANPSTEAINSGFTGSNSTGLLFGLGDNRMLFGTSEFTIDRSLNEVSTISWDQGNGAISTAVRVAVEIGGNWFASVETFSNTTAVTSIGNFPSGAERMTFTFTSSASAWNSLTLNPGTELSMGSTLSASLPSGSITSFGLYIDNRDSTLRFDNFSISVIPEPSTYAALLGLSLIGLIALRQRRG